MNSAADGIYGTDSGTLLTSNFMEHGTLAARIRWSDYRPFLLTLYSNLCFAMDAGTRYAPEDAIIPGSFAGEGAGWTWSAVVNSSLQPTMALRWLLCYEESDADRVHLQKAAPKHWFSSGQKISVRKCPTRFGEISWSTEPERAGWTTKIEFATTSSISPEIVLHIHPADGRTLVSSSIGQVDKSTVVIPADAVAQNKQIVVEIR